ncbi:MAG: hypothetical protein K2M23_00105 [Alphaproteobacteria bacterium]|nr:hypothetical protein [Alphaproteobacteria bacterium]
MSDFHYGTDENDEKRILPAKFYFKGIFNEEASLQEKRPIFKSQIFLEVDTSDTAGIFDIKIYPVNEYRKKQFPKEWKIFSEYIYPFVKYGIEDNYSLLQLKNEYPEIYKEYIERLKKDGIEGELIEEAGYLPLSKAIELKYHGIFTTEQLANMEPNIYIPAEIINIAKNHKEIKDNEKNIGELLDMVKQLTQRLNNERIKYNK